MFLKIVLEYDFKKQDFNNDSLRFSFSSSTIKKIGCENDIKYYLRISFYVEVGGPVWPTNKKKVRENKKKEN